MIPKKKRRIMTIDDEQYEYSITGYTSIFIKSLQTAKVIKHYQYNKPKWKTPVKPSDVKKIIQNGKKFALFK